MKNYQSKKREFTLIELLVVIAMIAIATNNSIKVKQLRFILKLLSFFYICKNTEHTEYMSEPLLCFTFFYFFS